MIFSPGETCITFLHWPAAAAAPQGTRFGRLLFEKSHGRGKLRLAGQPAAAGPPAGGRPAVQIQKCHSDEENEVSEEIFDASRAFVKSAFRSGIILQTHFSRVLDRSGAPR